MKDISIIFGMTGQVGVMDEEKQINEAAGSYVLNYVNTRILPVIKDLERIKEIKLPSGRKAELMLKDGKAFNWRIL